MLYLPVKCMDILIMLLLAALYGCGMGGGGLLVVYLTMFRGMAQADAQALNLFFYVIASTASAFVLLKRRNINYRLVILCSLAGIPGAYLGSLLRRVISVVLLKKIFGAMLIVTGVSVFLSKNKGKE
ncbi:MAG: sulfite exporter TauE/SafE family protein [Ruminococcaceae bacterium]|nr:sulfite exporter TauE/SafE family protein [Oscillospiraceae bacterium]